MNYTPHVSIITVNYNGGEVLARCVQSVFQYIHTPVELIVYDNASADGSMASLPSDDRLVKIHGSENLGFARGNNKAAAAAKGVWLHFLNPDILVNPRLDTDYAAIVSANKRALYVTSLLGPDGQPQHMSMLIPTLGNYITRIFNPSQARYWSIGASIIVHRDTFREMGGWCEDYFMYSEDLDLFYTAHQLGVPVVHLDTGITHIGKVSSSSAWNAGQRAYVIEKSFKKFFIRHRNRVEYHIVRLIQLPYQLIVGSKEFGVSLRAYLRVNFGPGQ